MTFTAATVPLRARRPGWAACGLLLGLAGAPVHAAPSFGPASSSVTAGGSFTVALDDTIDPTLGIIAFDLDIHFNPADLTLTEVDLGTLTKTFAPLVYNVRPGDGSASAFDSTFNGAAGSGSVIGLDFTSLGTASGPTTVTLESPAADAGVDGQYQLASLSFVATITPPAKPPPSVPAPGLACLLLPALALTVMRRRRDG